MTRTPDHWVWRGQDANSITLQEYQHVERVITTPILVQLSHWTGIVVGCKNGQGFITVSPQTNLLERQKCSELLYSLELAIFELSDSGNSIRDLKLV